MERRLLLKKLMVSMPQLATPTISLSNDILSIEEVENAEYYDIYVDGVLEESVPAVSGYEVSITVQNGISLSDWQYTKIYDDFDGFSPSGNELGSISTANGSTTVRTTTGKICVVLQGGFIGTSNESHSSTGGVSNVELYYGGAMIQYNAVVSADGTLVISGIDFDD